MHADDCERYYNANANGLVLQRNLGTEHQPSIRENVVFVNKAAEPSPVGGVLKAMIEEGATRCVRISGGGLEWTKEGLWKLAECGGKFRVENVVVGEERGVAVGVDGEETSVSCDECFLLLGFG